MKTTEKVSKPDQDPQRQSDKQMIEDERGWAGQHGQRPANEPERKFRIRPRPANFDSPDY